MACGLAPNVEFLIVARIVQGVGAAILVPSSLALVIAAFPREKLPQVVAI
jgi:MFS family permease